MLTPRSSNEALPSPCTKVGHLEQYGGSAATPDRPCSLGPSSTAAHKGGGLLSFRLASDEEPEECKPSFHCASPKGATLLPTPYHSVFLIFAELALCLAAAVEWFTHPKVLYVETYTWLVWPTLSIAVLVDIVTTSTLTYYLRKSRTGFKRTDSLVDVLMVYTINTGLSTSMLTTVALICAITMRNNTVYSAILIVATRMYANSMLAVLNSRNSILDKGQGNPLGTLTFGLDVMHRSNRQAENRRAVQSIQFKHRESPLHARNSSEVNNMLHIQGKKGALLLSPKRDDSDIQTPQTGTSINDHDE